MSSTREDILKAGTELFCEKGFDKTTVRDICNQAKANVAAVNYHFKGKIGLGEAVVDHLFGLKRRWFGDPLRTCLLCPLEVPGRS